MITNLTHQSLNEIYPVSRETFERLERYVTRLLEWQEKTNLIANSTKGEIWSRHVADSLQCLALKPNVRRWLDLGSGAGFPGLVISACMKAFDETSVTLVESNQKKSAFLRQANRAMDANAIVHNDRIEAAASKIELPEIVTARALASLPELFNLSSPWICNGAQALFHKGREYRAELSECDGLWTYDLIIHESRIEPDSVILEISNLRSKDA
ncbi:MAG: 16S rRNA (guanine(527)-N(7))-methyltransferase RsmG [Pseudomonadota bacterium]